MKVTEQTLKELLVKLQELLDKFNEPVISVDYDPLTEYEAEGMFTSERLLKASEDFFKEAGHTAPTYFLPDLDGFNSKFTHYRTVIEAEENLSPLQKATYYFTQRYTGAIIALFLSKRKPVVVQDVVVSGEGEGVSAFGFQGGDQKLAGCYLAPGVKTVAQAEEFQKEWIKGFFGYAEASGGL